MKVWEEIWECGGFEARVYRWWKAISGCVKVAGKKNIITVDNLTIAIRQKVILVTTATVNTINLHIRGERNIL